MSHYAPGTISTIRANLWSASFSENAVIKPNEGGVRGTQSQLYRLLASQLTVFTAAATSDAPCGWTGKPVLSLSRSLCRSLSEQIRADVLPIAQVA